MQKKMWCMMPALSEMIVVECDVKYKYVVNESAVHPIINCHWNCCDVGEKRNRQNPTHTRMEYVFDRQIEK